MAPSQSSPADEALPNADLPGLSQWALIGLAVLLGAAVCLRLGRRSLRQAA